MYTFVKHNLGGSRRSWGAVALLSLIICTSVFSPFFAPTAYAADPPAPGSTPTKPPEHPIDNCGVFSPGACIEGIFYALFVQLTAGVAYIGGTVFDFVAALALQGGTYADPLINQGWRIARDLANMTFVFLLVYLAFQLILNVEGVGVGKALAKIIAVALLINFSFFFARVVIDGSNILAHQFYDRIRGPVISGAAGQQTSQSITVGGSSLQVKAISEQIMAGINPQALLSNSSFIAYRTGTGFLQEIALMLSLFVMFAVINLIIAVVFFSAAIQFLFRIVTLWLSIMLAPLGFIALIIPGMSKYSSMWWDHLIKSAFFAPAFLLFFYIIVLFVSGNNGGLLGQSIGQALYAPNVAGATTVTGFFHPIIIVMIRLGIVIGLLVAALKMGSVFGQVGSRAILSNTSKFAGAPFKAGMWMRNKLTSTAANSNATPATAGIGAGAGSGGRVPFVSRYRDLGARAMAQREAQNRQNAAAAAQTVSVSATSPLPPPINFRNAPITLATTQTGTAATAPTLTAANNANLVAANVNMSPTSSASLENAIRGMTNQVEQLTNAMRTPIVDMERKANDQASKARIDDTAARLSEQKKKDEEQLYTDNEGKKWSGSEFIRNASGGLTGADALEHAIRNYNPQSQGPSTSNDNDEPPPPPPRTPVPPRTTQAPEARVIEGTPIQNLRIQADAQRAAIPGQYANDNRPKAANDDAPEDEDRKAA